MTNPPPPPEPEPVAVAPVVAPPPTDLIGDLLGDMGGSSVPAPAPAIAPMMHSEPEAKTSPNLYLLLRSTKGVLYEDQNLQIGWMEAQPYANRIGQIALYYQLRAAAALEQFEANVSGPNGALLLKVAPLEPSLQAGKQQIQRLDVRLEQPYTALPKLTVKFVTGGMPVAMQIEIPIEVAKFAAAYAAGNAQQFAAVWAQGAASEVQETITTKRPFELASIGNLLKALKLELCDGVDKNPQNLVAGAQITTATNRQWFLMRFECAPSKVQFRITGRATSPEFAAAMVESVKQQLLSV